ncbi:SRPBCC family protein [Candidatus Obscuribacterales bacterium]|jgi:ribosome-associated toxin RatA of RatAB toxin-antitoxin module|nr:SRPBCC family protein [Candidatus Obscuribacterales bacterium]MBX3136336.1 SRPBCC family protein [Candidatus Obscuribacterales bacterium]MBX3152340.1 SRPBCC family protein [Candidatus Obscuribacterales bacterium]
MAVAAVLTLGLSGTASADSHSSGVVEHATVTESVIDGDRYSVTKIVVHAAPHQVWNVLSDFDNAPKVFPQMKKCEVIKDEGHSKIVKHTVAPSGPVGTYSYTLRITEKAPKYMEWHRLSGAFKQVKGFWKLEPLDNGRTTQVTYASFVDGGFFVPAPLIRRQSRIDMPSVMTALKSQVESKIQIAGKP